MGNSASENSSDDDEDERESSTEKTSDDEEETERSQSPMVRAPMSEDEDDSDSTTNSEPDRQNGRLPNVNCFYEAEDLVNALNLLENTAEINQISKHQAALLNSLQNRRSRGQAYITKQQFCEVLINSGLGESDSQRVFSLFDTEGRQQVHVSSAIEFIQSNLIDLSILDYGIAYPLQVLSRCDLMPGFVDICGEISDFTSHEKRLDNKLQQASLSTDILPIIPDGKLDSLYRSREFLFNHWLDESNTLIDAISKSKENMDTNKNMEPSEEFNKAKNLKTCYEFIRVSTNKKTAMNLTDGDPNTYWQSDGSTGSHWILIRLKKDVIVKKLSIAVSPNDINFMPRKIDLYAGRSISNLARLTNSSIEIKSHARGDVLLKSDFGKSYRFIRINITRCKDDGCDTRVRGIKIDGYRLLKKQTRLISSLEESGILWYLNILTSTVSACIPIAPTLENAILEHSKKLIEHMTPLSLITCDTHLSIITPNVLHTVFRSLTEIFNVENETSSIFVDEVKILFSLALADLNLNHVIRLVRILLNSKTQLPQELVDELEEKMKTSMILIPRRYDKHLEKELHVDILATTMHTWDDDERPNVQLASKIIHFTKLIRQLACDSKWTTPMDLENLSFCFEDIFNHSINETLEIEFLYFISKVFSDRPSLLPKSDRRSEINRIWNTLNSIGARNPKSPEQFSLAQDILRNGVEIFYQNETERRDKFFSLLAIASFREFNPWEKAVLRSLCEYYGSQANRPLFDLQSTQDQTESLKLLYTSYAACQVRELKKMENEESICDDLGKVVNVQQFLVFASYFNEKKKLATNGNDQSAVDQATAEILVSSLRELRKFIHAIADVKEIFKQSGINKRFVTTFKCLYELAISALRYPLECDLSYIIITELKNFLSDDVLNSISDSMKINEKFVEDGLVELNSTKISFPTSDSGRQQRKLFRHPGAVGFEILINPDNKDKELTGGTLCFVNDHGREIELKSYDHSSFTVWSKDQLQLVFSPLEFIKKRNGSYEFQITPLCFIDIWTSLSDLFLILARFSGFIMSMQLKHKGNSHSSNANQMCDQKKNFVSFLETIVQFLGYFRSMDDKFASSKMCLTFLQPTADVVDRIMDSTVLKGVYTDPVVMEKLKAYFMEIISCQGALADDTDRHFWGVNIVRLLSQMFFNFQEFQFNDTEINEILRLIFAMATSQQQLLKKETVVLENRSMDQRVCAALREKETTCSSCLRPLDQSVRYCCLDSIETILCLGCTLLGEGPITRTGDHRLVAFNFKCDKCEEYIVGNRFHCTICGDYDLCPVCKQDEEAMEKNNNQETRAHESAGETNTVDEGNSDEKEDGESTTHIESTGNADKDKAMEHKSEHSFVQYPATYIRSYHANVQLLNQYLAEYSWLLLTKLAVQLPECDVRLEGWRKAFWSNLINVAKCQLMQPHSANIENSTDDMAWMSRLSSVQRTDNEGLLGLISIWCQKHDSGSTELHGALVLIFAMLKNEANLGRTQTDQTALWLLGKLSLIAGPAEADRAINSCSRTPVDGCDAGYLTLQFLFIFGSSFLTSKEWQWSWIVAKLLTNFFNDPKWSSITAHFLEIKMTQHENSSSTDMAYANLILVGYPNLYYRGMDVGYLDCADDQQSGIALEIIGEKFDIVKILNPNTRRVQYVNVKDIRKHGNERISSLVNRNIWNHIGLSTLFCDTQVNVVAITDETNWLSVDSYQLFGAALTMKAFSMALKNAKNMEQLNEIFASDFLKELMEIVRRQTTLPLGTEIKTLEIIIGWLISSSVSMENEGDSDLLEGQNGLQKGDEHLLSDIPDDLAMLLLSWRKEFNAPLSVLRAIYFMKTGNMKSVLQEVRSLFLTRSNFNSELGFRAAWVKHIASLKAFYQEQGKHYIPPDDFEYYDSTLMEKYREVAKTTFGQSSIAIAYDEDDFLADLKSSRNEWSSKTGRLIEHSDDGERPHLYQEAFTLLMDLFKDDTSSNEKAVFRRISSALAILYARKLLSDITIRWPAEIVFTKEHFGFTDSLQLFNMIDMFNLTPDCITNVPRAIDVVLGSFGMDSMVSHAVTCCVFLQAGSDKVISRKSAFLSDPAVSAARYSEFIEFSEVTSTRLLILLEQCISSIKLEYNDSKGRKRILSPPIQPIDVVLNTNAVKAHFILKKFGADNLIFKAIGRNFRYFDTGYEILRKIINNLRKEPKSTDKLNVIWIWLVYCTCRSFGTQRLRLIDLLNRLITLVSISDTPVPIDLHMAKPLWKLFTDLESMCHARKLVQVPELVRKLAEFFYVLENLAIKRSERDQYSLAMCDHKPAIRSYAHGCRIIANICAEIGLENELTTILENVAVAVLKKDNEDLDEAVSEVKVDQKMEEFKEAGMDSDDEDLPDLVLDYDPSTPDYDSETSLS